MTLAEHIKRHKLLIIWRDRSRFCVTDNVGLRWEVVTMTGNYQHNESTLSDTSKLIEAWNAANQDQVRQYGGIYDRDITKAAIRHEQQERELAKPWRGNT